MDARRDDVTLQALVGDRRLGLRLVVPAADAALVIRGHHVTDLDQPARYLLPGELLLTNGLWLHRRPAAEWIAEVKSAGVAVLAFGLTDDWPTVPEIVVLA